MNNKNSYSRYSYRSRHCAAVLPIIGAIVLHWVGISLAKCKSFSSSSLFHSVFFILGSNHSNHLALHCFADFLCSNDAIRLHWFFPYFITAAFKISSCNLHWKFLILKTHLNDNQSKIITIITYLGVSPNTTLYHNSRHFCNLIKKIIY